MMRTIGWKLATSCSPTGGAPFKSRPEGKPCPQSFDQHVAKGRQFLDTSTSNALFFLKVKQLTAIRLVAVSTGFASMGFWQRLVATILLLTFIPASLAAAMPIVYCFGADGHRGIELVQSTPHHAIEHDHVDAGHGELGAAFSQSDDCVDYKVVSLNGVPPRGFDLKLAVEKMPAPLVATIPTCRAPGRHVSRADARHRQSPGNKPPIDHLASHRTTVLLI
jgi:hypothetical protein